MATRRRYELGRRAEGQEATRRRIAEAALELHETVGPARTTISAIAERAGVQRLTVYRHFPDERSLYAACSARWDEDHPPPDPAAWEEIEGAPERLRAVLGAFYEYYEDAEPMLGSLIRDEADVAVLGELMRPFHDLLEALADDLSARFRARGQRRDRIRALVAHALELSTFQSLVLRRGLAPRDAANLMASAVESA